ncbi:MULTISPECIES: FecCD family ABC transporter permease [unclassified Campylobacter]|uniref:FecCD family ABC transporter permease n=1 Tax=unclassified Campylobacter TaxID=2593542 RepID=UPI001237D476|nr:MULTISPECIES: iron ABC transporter permease [unclassified Campylobacter]KAA6225400.1 iron ABC transporter permease [Campylobacter sp. LR185c]KAA6227096.1 iron ABC transporter permease [Campylobacter sp. LR196d]KAA6228722.1 iron ABC transporter permease [Campylobacter sp. LR286c]KAA6229532.1 iron ABC transporter permease [Campylobacter sp. LR264d]KAA6230776.1 iron ABC transporter permease [Campylobacter sp. LR291e]
MKILLSLLIILILGFLTLGIGRYDISYAEIYEILLYQNMNDKNFIILNVRLPRVILAIIVGAGLGISGASLQAIFRNPLASPDILGVSSGASFGAVLSLILGLNIYFLTLTSFLCGLLSLGLTIIIARDFSNKIMIILGGIIIAALFQSFISLLKYIADPQDTLPTITYWLLGSLQVSNTHQILFCCAFIIIFGLIIYLFRWKHNILMLDDNEAKTLGFNVIYVRLFIIFCVTLIIACIVSMCGIIGWIGLVIPHIARMIAGFNTAKVIAYSIVIGSIFMLLIDTLARTLINQELPLSVLSAIVGAPFFIAILYKYKGLKI